MMTIKALPTTKTNSKSPWLRLTAMDESFHPDDDPHVVEEMRQLFYLILEDDLEGFKYCLSNNQLIPYFESKSSDKLRRGIQKTIWSLATHPHLPIKNQAKFLEAIITTIPEHHREEWIFNRAADENRFCEIFWICSVDNIDFFNLVPDLEGAIKKREASKKSSCLAEFIRHNGYNGKRTNRAIRSLISWGSNPNLYGENGNAIHAVFQSVPLWQSVMTVDEKQRALWIEQDKEDCQAIIQILSKANVDFNARTPKEQKTVFHLLDDRFFLRSDEKLHVLYHSIVMNLLLHGAKPPENWDSDLPCVKEYRSIAGIAAETRSHLKDAAAVEKLNKPTSMVRKI